MLNVRGRCFEGDEMVEAWASYFQELASPADHNYNSSFSTEIDGEL